MVDYSSTGGSVESDVNVTISTQACRYLNVSVNLIQVKNVLVGTRRVIFDVRTNSTNLSDYSISPLHF